MCETQFSYIWLRLPVHPNSADMMLQISNRSQEKDKKKSPSTFENNSSFKHFLSLSKHPTTHIHPHTRHHVCTTNTLYIKHVSVTTPRQDRASRIITSCCDCNVRDVVAVKTELEGQGDRLQKTKAASSVIKHSTAATKICRSQPWRCLNHEQQTIQAGWKSLIPDLTGEKTGYCYGKKQRGPLKNPLMMDDILRQTKSF